MKIFIERVGEVFSAEALADFIHTTPDIVRHMALTIGEYPNDNGIIEFHIQDILDEYKDEILGYEQILLQKLLKALYENDYPYSIVYIKI